MTKVRFRTCLDSKTEVKLLQKIWSNIPSVFLTSSITTFSGHRFPIVEDLGSVRLREVKTIKAYYPMQSHNSWYIYTGFIPNVSSIDASREHYFFIYGDFQASNSFTRHMVIEFKAHVPRECQWRTVQFCIISSFSWTGCFYVHEVTFKEMKINIE